MPRVATSGPASPSTTIAECVPRSRTTKTRRVRTGRSAQSFIAEAHNNRESLREQAPRGAKLRPRHRVKPAFAEAAFPAAVLGDLGPCLGQPGGPSGDPRFRGGPGVPGREDAAYGCPRSCRRLLALGPRTGEQRLRDLAVGRLTTTRSESGSTYCSWTSSLIRPIRTGTPSRHSRSDVKLGRRLAPFAVGDSIDAIRARSSGTREG